MIGAGCHPSTVENPILDNLFTLRAAGDDDMLRVAGDALRAACVVGMFRAADEMLRVVGDMLRVFEMVRVICVGAVEMRESGIPISSASVSMS